MGAYFARQWGNHGDKIVLGSHGAQSLAGVDRCHKATLAQWSQCWDRRTLGPCRRAAEKWLQKEWRHPVTGDGSKVWCCKEPHCIGTWNVRSMNRGKLEVVKLEMARVNIDILEISELKWTGMGEFNSDDHYIYHCRQESLRKKWTSPHSQQKSPKCSTSVQSQKWQWSLFISKANHSLSQ